MNSKMNAGLIAAGVLIAAYGVGAMAESQSAQSQSGQTQSSRSQMAQPQSSGTPSSATPVTANEVVIKGQVEKVSSLRKEIQVKVDDNTKVALRIDPSVIPIQDIKKGDQIQATYLEAVALSLEPTQAQAKAPVMAEEKVQVTPSQGSATPTTIMVNTADITAQVESVDKANRTVTLKDPDGNQLVLKAGPDIREFDQLKAGDRILARYTQAMAIEVQRA
jgi:hypothetical protein